LAEKIKSFLWRYFLAGTWTICILILCGLPREVLPPMNFWDFDWWDKIAHVGIFFIWSVLIVFGAVRKFPSRSRPKRFFAFILLSGMAYAALTEILQELFFTGRYGDPVDFLSDSVGVVFGTFLAKSWFTNRP